MPASPARRVPVLALALFALLATCTSTVAQSTGGRVLGRITDPSGAVLSGVKVVLTNQATGASRDATTSSGGDYVFVEVVPGKYDVAFEHSGFKKNVSKDVLVEVNQVVTLDSVLQLGDGAGSRGGNIAGATGRDDQHPDGRGRQFALGVATSAQCPRYLPVIAVAARSAVANGF